MELLKSAAFVEQAKLRQKAAFALSKPTMGVILALNTQGTVDPGSRSYVKRIVAHGNEVGVPVKEWRLTLDALADTKALRRRIDEANLSGVLVQGPFPGISNREQRIKFEQAVYDAIPPIQELEGLGRYSPHFQPTPWGIASLLIDHGIDVKDKTVTFNGAKGRYVGMGTVELLKARGAEVLEVDQDNKDDLEKFIKASSILITAVGGQPGRVTADMLHEGMTVVDAGYAQDEVDGTIVSVGDVDRAVYSSGMGIRITPHIGGVGRYTTAASFENLDYVGQTERRLSIAA